MTKEVHRWLMFVGGVCGALGGATGAADIIDPQIASMIALAGSIAIIVANQWRVSFPDTPAGGA